MYRISAFSLRQRSVVLLAAILIAVIGGFGATQLETELIPSVDFPIITVSTTNPGVSPEVIDADITMPVVNAVRALPGLSSVRSTSSEGSSIVVAEFEYGTNMKDAAQALTATLGQMKVPDGASRPDVQRINMDQAPVVQLSLTGANGDLAALRSAAQQRLVPALTAIDGVGRVVVTGGADDIVLIKFDPAKMAEAKITPQQVAGILQSSNVSAPAGTVQTGDTTLPVRVGSQIDSLDQLRAVVVGVKPESGYSASSLLTSGGFGLPADASGTPVTLGDIATVDIAPGAAPGITRMNGQPSVAIDVYMNQGANTVDTASSVREKLDSLTNDLHAAGTDITPVIVQDQSRYIQESIDGLVREALLGAGFAVVVIFGFLLSARSTLVTAISIPLSLLVAFILLWWQGISLNIMTLGGLAVAVGRVVDDAIVILESIYRHVQRGEDSRTATLSGVREVAMAITASTATTIAVFLPLGFTGGIIGEFFRPFALTVTFALVASLVVALTVVPVLASYLIRRGKLRPVPTRPPVLQRVYVPLLRRSLAHPVITLVIAGTLFFGSFGLVPFIGTSFLPSSSDKVASIQVAMPPGTSQAATLAKATDLEEVIRQAASVQLLQTQVGGGAFAFGGGGAGASTATITARFDPNVDLPETLARLRDRLTSAAGDARISVQEQSQGAGGGNALEVVLKGNDYGQVSQAAESLTSQISSIPNIVNVKNDVVNAKPEVAVTVDPTKAMEAGTNPAQIMGQVRQALTTSPIGMMTIGGVPYQVAEQVAGAASNLDDLRQLPVGGAKPVPLEDVATVTEATGPVQVVRVDGNRAATISGTITSDDTGAVTRAVSDIVNRYEAPPGVTVSVGGVAREQGEAFQKMGLALGAAVLLVYIVMVASFGSLSTPFVILFSLPLAVIGVLGALALTGKTIGLPALIGLMMLIGIVVTNAIVLLELVIDLRRRGYTLDAALIEGGRTRLRPILMTALATILALIPLALSRSSGAIIASDLAVVVIGGLLTSTFLTLIVVPVVFKLIARRQERTVPSMRGDTAPDVSPDQSRAILGLTLAWIAREARKPDADPELLADLASGVNRQFPHHWTEEERGRKVAGEILEPLARELLRSYAPDDTSDGQADRYGIKSDVAS